MTVFFRKFVSWNRYPCSWKKIYFGTFPWEKTHHLLENSDYPHSVRLDERGNIFIVDTNNHVIRRISSDGSHSIVAGMLGIQGDVDGPSHQAQLRYPRDISFDSNGNIYIATINK